MELSERLNSLMDAESNNPNQQDSAFQRLSSRVERLSLITNAICECLEETGVSHSALIQKISEIQHRDDNQFSRKTHYLEQCDSCGSMVAARHNYCVSCGTRLSKNFIL